jgi:hypothetical protein
MNHSKPKVFGPARPTCPVCGETAYSRGGIHPQCAVNREDQADQVVLKAQNAALPTPPRPQAKNQWTKRCPGCRLEVHVRLAICGCGYSFQPKLAG